MSMADVLDGQEPIRARVERTWAGDARVAWCRIAAVGLAALVLVAPFETLRPVVRLPGQTFSSVEVVLLAVLTVCAVTAWPHRAWTLLRVRALVPLGTLVLLSFAAALAAPAFGGNAFHMAARLATLAAVWQLTAAAAADASTRQRLLWAVLASGTLAALLVVADFVDAPGVRGLLSAFRESVAVVGAQVRASGPFQYPTIASMYLEITFAVGVGLLLGAGSTRLRVLLVLALGVIFEGIVLTFTRAGLITAMLALGTLTVRHWRLRGVDRAVLAALLVGVGALVQIATSRSAEMLMLRLTSEGQGRWFSAVFDVPRAVRLDTRGVHDVPVTITNTGRATWDSDAAEPVSLSYHWIAADTDDVVAWEGERTPFPSPVRPGESVSLHAQVGGPGRPGQFRLMWDLEQEGRLWFSTEPDAVPMFSDGTVTGPATSQTRGVGPRRIPRATVRPGRLELWAAAFRMAAAHPWLGVGPDNYRLLYGQFSTLTSADPRVHSNNMYLEVLAGMGAAGLASLLWVGVGSAREAWRAAAGSDAGAGVAAACTAVAIHGLVDSFLSFTATYLLIGVMLGLASAWARDGEGHAHRI